MLLKKSCNLQKFGLHFNKVYFGNRSFRVKSYQGRIRFYKSGNYKMHVGMNIDFLKSHYIIGFKVPFAKLINRKKYATIVEETNARNREFDLCNNDAMYVDDYGHVCGFLTASQLEQVLLEK